MSGSYERPWVPRQRRSLLVVDDDRAMLETLVAMLDQFHDVVGTTEPSLALAYLAEREFHVVVADWMMPAMNGVEFFRRVTTLGKPVTCLLITGRIEEFGAEVCREDRRMIGILAKPFTERQLLERVDQLGRLAAMKQQVTKLRGTG